MKQKFTLLFAFIASLFSGNAQTILLNEGFTSPWAPTGWAIQNNSVPLGTASWFQGSSSVYFNSFAGGPDDYVGVNYQSQGSTTGGISNFLITPTVTLVNGATFKFVTRTNTPGSATYPDRLQVLMSQGTGTGAIGSGTAAVGTFTTLCFDINPNLTTTGYPVTWTVYTYTVSGITGTTPGRFAFRYFVSNGGSSGINSDMIGIDEVVYTVPAGCNPPVVNIGPASPIVCGGGNVNLTASGASSYTWSNGSNGTSINVSPSSTTVYTVSGSNIPGCNGVASTTVTVVSQPTVTANSVSVCTTQNVTLTANGASTYSWNTGASSQSITVSPGSTTVYTVTGIVGSCQSTATAAVVFISPPTVSAASQTVCPGATTTVSASGANSYTWSTGAIGSFIVFSTNVTLTLSVTGSNGPGCDDTEVITVTTNTFLSAPSITACPNVAASLGASGALIYNWSNGATTASIIITPTASSVYTVTGNNGTCSETKTVGITVDPWVIVPNFTTCAGTAATLIASGASSYTWSNGSNSSLIIVTPTANTVYTVTGGNGTCTDTKTVEVAIGNNLSVSANYSCIPNSGTLILTASGASSYTWFPGGQNSPNLIFVPSAASVYTVAGASGTCTGQTTVTVAYCAGVEENYNSYLSSMVVYPNPFVNELNITGAYGNVTILNSIGQVIMTTTVEESTTISAESFAQGIYFVLVHNPKTNERKMVKVVRN
ncbi:MAG: hypothetical protein K0S32_1646 [Bacteroidetes bacterium]|jgi:hypothetical protein|nr:hypothetical protein [Bacteroidota bacterium]